MDIICSLVHFCDIHGPTSIICTQALPVFCESCYQSETSSYSGDTQRTSPSTSFQHQGKHQTSTPINIHTKARPISSPFATPPASPQSLKSPSFSQQFPYHGSDPDTYQRSNSASEADSETCGYCSYSVPRDIRQQIRAGAPGSPAKDGKGRHGSPIMRSQERIYAHDGTTPPQSDCSEDGHLTRDHFGSASSTQDCSTNQPQSFPRQQTSPYCDTPPMSRTSSLPHCSHHSHTITYLTTRSPSSPTTYTTLRHSTLRALSCETLAPGSPSGSLLFGDTNTGYTIAYKFRCMDPTARGGIARYALTMLVGKSWRRAGIIYGRVVGVFERLAERLGECAEAALAREAERKMMRDRDGDDICVSPGKGKARMLTPVSSFLDAKTVDPDGVAKRSSGFLGARGKGRGKGLAELLGEEGFFVECHVEFVRLLSGLRIEFGWAF